MAASKTELAYNAGAQLRRADNSTLPAEAVSDPVAACPFPEGDSQRAAWLKGYAEAHEQEQSNVSAVKAALKQEESS